MALALPDMLRLRARESPDAHFLKCGHSWLSFADLDRSSDELAAGLIVIGVVRGDRVAVLCDSRPEVFEVLFACAKVGAIHIQLNAFLKGAFLQHQLADSGATVLIGDESGIRAAASVLVGTAVAHIISLDEHPDARAGKTIQQLRRQQPLPPLDIHPDSLAQIIYTSGTTGPSKGCMLSHGYLSGVASAYYEFGWVRDGDRVFTSLPFFHLAAINCMLLALYVHRGSVVFEPTFSASAFMSRAAEENATVTWGMGAMGEAILARHPKDVDVSPHLRMCVWMALHADSAREFERRFGAVAMISGYGQTECQPITLSRWGEQMPGSVGRPCPALDVRIVDELGFEVPRGEIGEIVVRPRMPNALFSGYWNNPAATLETWRGLWHHTGDVGSQRDSGDITFLDRKKDSLRRRGENVSSFEVEGAIARFPGIARVAVCAVSSPLGEDDIKACIVPHPGHTVTVTALFTYFRDELPYYAIPRYVQLRESLPVTAATGRVRKHVLREEGITPDTVDLEVIGLRVSRDERRC